MTFYSVFLLMLIVATYYFRRSTKECAYFSGLVIWLVFQSMYLYDYRHLNDDLAAETTPAVEESPSLLFNAMFTFIYFHELFLYLLVGCVITCSVCVCIGLAIETRNRRRRQQAWGEFPEYNEREFDGPDLARADSIKARVGHIEKIKKAAKTQLEVQDGSECIICMNEFVRDDELVQLECS
jgi:hypothetical protein